MKTFAELVHDAAGATAIEYGLVTMLISILMIIAAAVLGQM